MISHSVKSNTNGSGGVVTYLTTTEYYLNRDGKDGGTVWFAGAGAVAFGLKDGMDLEDMRGAMGRMMNGFHPTERDPETGAPVALVQNAGQPCKSEVRLDLDGKPLLKADGLPDMVWTGARVMGHDLTYSPPKAFSALYAMADAERQIAWRAALVEANNVGMQYMAEQGQTRTGSASGGTLQYERADVVWSSHCHFASRDLDPQLHVHNFVYNLARSTKDGEWRALENEGMMAVRKAADRVANAHLGHLLRQMGIDLEAVDLRDRKGKATGERTWTVAGMPDGLLATWSKRRTAIIDYLETHPGKTAAEACMATRKAKDEPELVVLARQWTEDLEKMRQTQGWKVAFDDYKRDGLGKAPAADWRTWNMDEFAAGFHANIKKSAGLMSAVEAEVAMRAVAMPADQIRAIAQEITADLFVPIGPSGTTADKWQKRQTQYVSKWWLAKEQSIQEIARNADSKNDRHHIVTDEGLSAAIAGFEARLSAKIGKPAHLFQEQADAVAYLTQQPGRLLVLEGLSGTGKTTSISAAIDAWSGRGLTTIGLSTSQDASLKLAEETGLKIGETAFNQAAFLKRLEGGQIKLTKDHVLVLDEAGMLDVIQGAAILQAADKAGTKVILMGDFRQLPSVTGGNPMGLIRDERGSVRLENITRQKGEDLEITKLLYGVDAKGRLRTDTDERTPEEARTQSEAIYKKMVDRGMVSIHAEQAQAVAEVANLYLSSAVPAEHKSVIVHTHSDRAAVNSAIRPVLREQGVLTGADFGIAQPGEHGWHKVDFAVGERIAFSENHTFTKDEPGWAVAKPNGPVRTPGGANPLCAFRVDNGTQAQVEHIREEPVVGRNGEVSMVHRITVRLMTTDDRNGTRVSWRTDTMPHFDHGYSSTAHKMQGQTKDAVWHLSSKSESNEQALVAFTRIKTNEHGTYKLVGTAETIEALRAGAMGRLAPQRNALDLMREAEEAKAVADDLAKNGPRGVVLVGHGEAPYKNDATQRMSYFISVRDDRDRERTMWGADLRRAMNDSGAKIGERITIACAGDNQDVTVDGKAAIRNGWAVDRVPQVQPIKPEPVKSPAPTVEHGHDRERVRERVRELVPPPARAAGRSWTF